MPLYYMRLQTEKYALKVKGGFNKKIEILFYSNLILFLKTGSFSEITKPTLEEEFYINKCKKNGFLPFDESCYKEIQRVGKSNLWRYFKGETLVSLKIIELDQDKVENIDKLNRLLGEKSIVQTLSLEEKFVPFLKIIGNFYQVSGNGVAKKLMLASDSGDFNLNELIRCRKIDQEKTPPYSEEEALNFLIQVIPLFVTLKKMRIYHSDIKPQNFVFSKEKMRYMIVNFGVSREIPIGIDDNASLEEFAAGGSRNFNSPEKNKYWDIIEFNEKHGLNKSHQEYRRLEKEDAYFNPFKCDIWGLAVSIERMVGGIDKIKSNHILQNALRSMKQPNFRERWSADQVAEYLGHQDINLVQGNLNKIEFNNWEYLWQALQSRINIMKKKNQL